MKRFLLTLLLLTVATSSIGSSVLFHRRGAFRSTLTDGLVAYWALDEASGTRSDAHTGGHDLTDFNTVGQGTGNTYANCASMVRASTEYLAYGDEASNSFGDEDFTVCIWVNMDDTAGGAFIAKLNTVGNQQSFTLQLNSGTTKFNFYVSPYGSNTSADNLDHPAVVSAGTWYFLVAQHAADDDEIRISVNGSGWTSKSYSLGVYDGTASLRIGNHYYGGEANMDGLAGPAFMYRRAITSDEVTALYNSGSGLKYNEL